MTDMEPKEGRFDRLKDKFKPGVRKWVFRILDGMASLWVLSFALPLFAFLSWAIEEDISDFITSPRCMMYWGLLAYSLIQAIPRNEQPKNKRILSLINAGAFLICSILAQFFIMDESVDSADMALFIVTALHYITMILGRIFSIIKRREARSIVCNVILILLLVACFVFGNDLVLPLFVILQMLVHIALISFSRIRFEVIRKIITKTYAAEILSGMLLLILAFSMVLPMIEKQIDSYGDALWYCFALVTTIGFGDITANHPIGRILSVILGAYGIVIVALITSIIVNFYSETKNDHDDEEDTHEDDSRS